MTPALYGDKDDYDRWQRALEWQKVIQAAVKAGELQPAEARGMVRVIFAELGLNLPEPPRN